MATYTLYAYVGTDTPSKIAIQETDKTIDAGVVAESTNFIDWSLFTRIEIILKYTNNDTDQFITLDDTTQPEVFEVAGGADNDELILRLGHVTGITAGTTYQMRLIVYDASTNDDGRVLVDYSTDSNTDTIVVKGN